MNHKEVKKILSAHGFQLARQKKHFVWRHPDGRVWIIPRTPSDKKALLNNQKDLENFLNRGRVRGAFGFTAIEESERADFERTLHPIIEKKRKEIKDRSIGIAIERIKPAPTLVTSIASVATPVSGTKAKPNTLDSYTVGKIFRKCFEQAMAEMTARDMRWYREEVEADIRQWVDAQADKESVDEHDREEFIADWVERRVAKQSAYVKEINREVCAASTRTFQKIIKRMQQEERVSGQEVRACLVKKFANIDANTEMLADLILTLAVCTLIKREPDMKLTMGENGFRFDTAAGTKSPVEMWDARVIGKPTSNISEARLIFTQEAEEEIEQEATASA